MYRERNGRRDLVGMYLDLKRDLWSRDGLVLSLDAQKAFDHLSWPFMFAVLSRYGFSGPFIQALQALYSNPSSQVQLSYLSQTFPLSNATRQGCPLWPLLFILSLEPLALAINSYPDIRGVSLWRRKYTLSLFADDILLTLIHSHISLPFLHGTLASFLDPYRGLKWILQKLRLYPLTSHRTNSPISNTTSNIVGALTHLNTWASISHPPYIKPTFPLRSQK